MTNMNIMRNMTNMITRTLPNLARNASQFVGRIFSILDRAFGMNENFVQSGLVKLIDRLDGAVGTVHQIVTNSTLVVGLRNGLEKANDVVDNVVLLLQGLVTNATFASLVAGGAEAGANLVRGAQERRHAKCLAAQAGVGAVRTNETIICKNVSTNVIDIIEGVILGANRLFDTLASTDSDSAANRLQAALRAGDMGAAVRIVAPGGGGMSPSRNALASLASGSRGQALTELSASASLSANGLAALEALERNDTSTAAWLLANESASTTEDALALAAMVEADAPGGDPLDGEDDEPEPTTKVKVPETRCHSPSDQTLSALRLSVNSTVCDPPGASTGVFSKPRSTRSGSPRPAG